MSEVFIFSYFCFDTMRFLAHDKQEAGNVMDTTAPTFDLLVHQTVQSVQGGVHPLYDDASLRLEHAPVVALVDRIIDEAIECWATDIHIEPWDGKVRIRLRIDGQLCVRHGTLPGELHAFLVSRLKVMAKLKITERRLPQDGRILYAFAGQQVDIRISTMPMLEGEKVVLRLLDMSHSLLDISGLSFSRKNEDLFRKLCHAPHGMFINSGPVNSGKTTTLYAALQALNVVERNIVTIEDPVEYHIPGLNQIQVNPQVELTFARGLRSVLRQDVDVIMVGEIRDEETARIAVRAALTGHLIFTTLHTNSALGAVFRLLEMKIEPYLFAAAVLGIMAQRLVRRLCPSCREKYVVLPGSQEAAFLGRSYHQGMQLYRASGCETCGYTGYLGRMAIQEILVIDDEIRQAVMAGADINRLTSLVESSARESLLTDGLAKAIEGHTSLAEIGRVIYGSG